MATTKKEELRVFLLQKNQEIKSDLSVNISSVIKIELDNLQTKTGSITNCNSKKSFLSHKQENNCHYVFTPIDCAWEKWCNAINPGGIGDQCQRQQIALI